MKNRTSMDQRFRVIINGVHFYTNRRQIALGVGDNAMQNKIVLFMLQDIESHLDTDTPITGYGTNKFGDSYQLDIA